MISFFKRHPYLLTLLISVLGLGIFLISTNPDDVSIGLLVLPAVLLFLIIFCLVQVFLGIFKLMKSNPFKRRLTALMSAALITIVVILQSTGGISGADVLLLGLIIVVSAIYIEKF